MATETEEVILKFEIEQGDAIAELEKTKKSIVQLKQEQAELNKAYKAGNVTLDEYVAESVRLEGILKKQQSTYGNVQKSVTGVKTQMDKLIDSNKKIATQFENTGKKISDATQNIRVAGVSVGDLTTKIGAFANPATAAVGIITALGAAYARSTAGAKDLEFAQNQLSAATTIITNKFASFITSAEDGEGALTKFLNAYLRAGELTPIGQLLKLAGLDLGDIAKESARLALTIEQLQDAERNELVIRAKVNQRLEENSEILTQINDSQTTYEEKVRLIGKAEDNITTSSKELVRVKRTQLSFLRLQLKSDKDNEAIQDKIALKVIEISNITKDEAKRKKQLDILESNLLDTETKRAKLAKEEREARERSEKRAVENLSRLDEGPEEISGSGLTSGIASADQQFADSFAKLAEDIKKINADLKQDQDNYTKAYIANKQAEIDATKGVLLATAGIFEEGSDLQKAFGLSSIAVDTGEAIASLTAASEGNPANAFTFGGAGTAQFLTGLARILTNIGVAKNMLSQAAGGGDFITKGPALLMVGDNPGGRERVTVEPLSGKGKTRLSKGGNLVAMAGGGTITSDGGMLTNSLVREPNQSLAMANALKQMPQPVLSVVEFNRVNKRVQVKERVSKL